MINFGRQATLNNRKFETLARAIAHKDPNNVLAIIAFEADAVTGEPAPADLFHDEIERLRASPEFQAYLSEEKLFADPAQPAVLRYGATSVPCHTLQEAVLEWQRSPAAKQSEATIAVRETGTVYDASQIDRLHAGPSKGR
jgi:hypothetical protein